MLCCILSGPVGNVTWMSLREGRSLNFRLRRGVGQAAHTHTHTHTHTRTHTHTGNNPHVNRTGVYCVQTVNYVDTSERYGVLPSWVWVSSLPHSLIVHLHTKLLVTVRDTRCDKKIRWMFKYKSYYSKRHIAINPSQNTPPRLEHTYPIVHATFWSSCGSPHLWVS